MTTAEIIETLRAHNEWRRGNDGGGEMLAPKLIGEAIDGAVEVLEDCDLLTEQLDFQRNLSREYVDLNTGWRKKWECAVEMAALAMVERDRYKAERDEALDALRKWDAVCVAADACNAEMESDEYSQTQWEAFEQKHTNLLESANRARLAVLFPANSHAHPPEALLILSI